MLSRPCLSVAKICIGSFMGLLSADIGAALLGATVEALMRVLLHGGPCRWALPYCLLLTSRTGI